MQHVWIEGVLEKSLHNQILIELGQERLSNVVTHPWQDTIELPDESRSPLPPDGSILNTFDKLDRRLLILGEPGSGKTVTLLVLSELLQRTANDLTGSEPIPVVFNLSSWGARRQPLWDWLVAELSAKYQIPRESPAPGSKTAAFCPCWMA